MDKEYILHSIDLEVKNEIYKNFINECKLVKEFEKYKDKNFEKYFYNIMDFGM